MDVKVYQKEEVRQPSGSEYVYVPNVIDIIPTIVEAPSEDIRNNVWTLDQLKQIADVRVVDNKLIINSDKVRYENGNLYVTLTSQQLVTCELAEGKVELEQQCALATIWQKGLDPLDLNDGISWSQAILEEVGCLQLIQEITDAIAKVTSSVKVVFDIVDGEDGNSYLSYKLLEVL